MRYLPHTATEVAAMLDTIGVGSIGDLFSTIPGPLQLAQPLQLPAATSEPDLLRELEALAGRNASTKSWRSFLGAGSYAHYIPAMVWQMVGRGEFLTPYTPYQPEISQGTLQVIFEYQSMMCELFGLDVANASNYDCSTAVAEAVLMARRVTRRQDYCIAASVHPAWREVAASVLHIGNGSRDTTLPVTAEGLVDRQALRAALTPPKDGRGNQCAACVVQYPSFYGTVEDLRDIAGVVHAAGALLVVVVPDPIAMGLLESPGAMGADIVVAEGQPLGNPVNYGGPYVGIFATRKQYLRQMPGRLAGLTTDTDGRRSFVLTLSTREQHIRREKATSNICTNQQLCALATTIYTAWLGKSGLRALAKINWEKAEYAKAQFSAAPGVTVPFAAPTFHEFVLRVPKVSAFLQRLRTEEIFGGVVLAPWYPALADCLLVCVTEQIRKDDIDRYTALLREHVAA